MLDRRDFTKSACLGLAGIAGLPGRSCRRRAGAETHFGFKFSVTRLAQNPVIKRDMDPRLQKEAEQYGYVNINGPSLIRVPSWVKNPLGKYYLYFAHHKGEYIRLAYADDLAGPWNIYSPGALDLADSYFAVRPAQGGIMTALSGVWRRNPPQVAWALVRVGLAARLAAAERRSEGSYGSGEDRPHIASPDVIVDEENQQVQMYFHGMLDDTVQMTRVALSPDGMNFKGRPELLASPYLRVFRHKGMYYGIGMPGIFYRSRDGLSNFEARPGLLFGVNMRHTALLKRGSDLFVFFTRVGDAPERILCSVIDISSQDWTKWSVSPPVEVLRPEYKWEGADLPVEPSIRGEITGPANQLRDPAIFEDKDKTFLLYSCAGEQAIAIAELSVHPN